MIVEGKKGELEREKETKIGNDQQNKLAEKLHEKMARKQTISAYTPLTLIYHLARLIFHDL